MSLYDYIFQFLNSYFFTSGSKILCSSVSVFGEDVELGVYLSDICTIVVMVLFFIALINLVLWCFKLGRHLLHL